MSKVIADKQCERLIETDPDACAAERLCARGVVA